MQKNGYISSELCKESGILTLWLDREDNERNQINTGMVSAMLDILAPELTKPSIKGLILASTKEKVFSTGADIEGELGGLDSTDAARFSRFGREVFGLFSKLDCPTVAAVSGFALGGGLELSLCFDFRVVLKNARMGLPEINLGVIPGWGGTQRLQRLIGRPRALKMILSGDPVNAAQALEFGLADEVVDTFDELIPACKKLIGKFSGKSRRTIGLAKRAVILGSGMDLEHGLNLESELFGLAWSTPDREEGIMAYMEKRRPKWPE